MIIVCLSRGVPSKRPILLSHLSHRVLAYPSTASRVPYWYNTSLSQVLSLTDHVTKTRVNRILYFTCSPLTWEGIGDGSAGDIPRQCRCQLHRIRQVGRHVLRRTFSSLSLFYYASRKCAAFSSLLMMRHQVYGSLNTVVVLSGEGTVVQVLEHPSIRQERLLVRCVDFCSKNGKVR